LMLLVLLSTSFLRRQSPTVVWLPSMMYFGFYLCCFCFYGFCGWVLVYVGDPFYRDFVLFIVAPISHQPLQGSCSFPSQIGAHISTPAKELLILTKLKTLQRAMPLINTNLVQSSFGADKLLALSKVDRTGKFFIPLELKILSFPTRLLFLA
jgi:hypothetical protein